MSYVDSYAHQHAILDGLVEPGDRRAKAVLDLRRYYCTSGPSGELFTGRHFDDLDGGGDAPEVRDLVTGSDVLAVGLLGMETGLARFALDVLRTKAPEVNELLETIPTTPIFALSESNCAAVLGRGSPAWTLWEVLRRCGGRNRPISAYKLLARKRPHLLPVYDSSVQHELEASGGMDIWECLWSWFLGRSDRVAAVEALRGEAGDIEHISLLRCLDVVLWMHGTTASRSDDRTRVKNE